MPMSGNANKARESLSIGDTVKVALCGGSINGLAVQAFGMLGFLMVLMLFGGVKHDVTSSDFCLISHATLM